MQLGYQWRCWQKFYDPLDTTIIVLMASDKKFNEIKASIGEDQLSHVHIDHGLTEVEPNTEVAVGWIE
jgi:hypothetical protein